MLTKFNIILHSNIYFNTPGPLCVFLPAAIFERLEEIQVCSIFSVQDTGLEVELGLKGEENSR